GKHAHKWQKKGSQSAYAANDDDPDLQGYEEFYEVDEADAYFGDWPEDPEEVNYEEDELEEVLHQEDDMPDVDDPEWEEAYASYLDARHFAAQCPQKRTTPSNSASPTSKKSKGDHNALMVNFAMKDASSMPNGIHGTIDG
ncbi:unnamed protein product, partial [Durusdinium trenchii]